jgi:alcohol dehydrogenase
VVGSHGMHVPRYAPMLAMIATAKLNPRALVSRTIALEETAAVLAAMDHYATLGIPVIGHY